MEWYICCSILLRENCSGLSASSSSIKAVFNRDETVGIFWMQLSEFAQNSPQAEFLELQPRYKSPQSSLY